MAQIKDLFKKPLSFDSPVANNSAKLFFSPKSVKPFISPVPDVTPTPTPTPTPMSIDQLITKYFPEDPKTAIAIFTHESQRGKFFKNLAGSDAYGVAQIMLPSHRDKIPGKTDAEKIEYLRDPENNLKIARQIYDKQGWSPWQSYTSGAYKKYL